jgi:hypothetical protein
MNDLDFEGGVIHPAAGLFSAALQEGFRKPAETSPLHFFDER